MLRCLSPGYAKEYSVSPELARHELAMESTERFEWEFQSGFTLNSERQSLGGFDHERTKLSQACACRRHCLFGRESVPLCQQRSRQDVKGFGIAGCGNAAYHLKRSGSDPKSFAGVGPVLRQTRFMLQLCLHASCCLAEISYFIHLHSIAVKPRQSCRFSWRTCRNSVDRLSV